MSKGQPKPSFDDDVRLKASPEEIRAAEQSLMDAVGKLGYPDASAFAIRLALEEALYNAFRHGHRNLPDTPVHLVWHADADQIVITVEDQGPGFNPAQLPDPTSDERIELPHGRGVMLMKAYMNEVEFLGAGNRVRMVYKRQSD